MSDSQRMEEKVNQLNAISIKLKTLRKEILQSLSPESVPGNVKLKRLKKKMRRNFQKKAEIKTLIAGLVIAGNKGKSE